jgi:hypothetical protein
VIGIQTDHLDPGQNATFTFVFLTGNVPYGDYLIVAKSDPLIDEVNFANNSLDDGTIRVDIPGDVNGDRKVDVYDLASISAHWSDPPEGPLGYDALVDIDSNDWIYISEIEITGLYWGVSW